MDINDNIEITTTMHGGEVWYKYILNGKESNKIAETSEVAFLLALEEKYDGINSQFTKFATRMLNIPTAWSK